jgi:UDP-2,3-diacylglucosamine pyrophosphatase LpxH
MRKFLQKIFNEPIIRMANKYASRPDEPRVHKALSRLFRRISNNPGRKGVKLDFNQSSKVIIFSDQHKGKRDYRDDFAMSEESYLAALAWYNQEAYLYCNLGDSEELWKNKLEDVIEKNTATFEIEKLFLQRNAFIKVFGNHDLYWGNAPLANVTLEKVYGQKMKVYEGVIFKMTLKDVPFSVFLTHGHQGDLQSDGNWFSKWFVSTIWGPFQAYLRINPNTPAYDSQLKSAHNTMMYNWTAKQSNLALITGHTHQPVFNSLTHLEQLYMNLATARKNGNKEEIQKIEAQLIAGKFSGDTSPRLDYSRNTYFNTGCCCFSDGDITGIEMEGGKIRLVKWKKSTRIVLDECGLDNLLDTSSIAT